MPGEFRVIDMIGFKQSTEFIIDKVHWGDLIMSFLDSEN